MGIAYGIDISDRSIELMGLSLRGKKPFVRTYGRTEIPVGIVNRGIIVRPDALADVLSSFLEQTLGPKRGRITAGVTLSEQVVFSKVFALPAALDAKAVSNALTIAAEEFFPIDPKDAVSDFIRLDVTNGVQRLYYAVADRAVVDAYSSILRHAGIVPAFIESEGLALSRICGHAAGPNLTITVDIGGKLTSLFAVDERGPAFSGVMYTAGDRFSAAISHALGVSPEETERLKRDVGLDPTKEDGKVYLAVEHSLSELLDEVKKIAAYCSKIADRPVAGLVLAGGSSLMPGIGDYFSSNVDGMSVMLADPAKSLDLSGIKDSGRFAKNALLFAVAAGTALRSAGAGGKGIDLSRADRKRAGPNPASVFKNFFNAFHHMTPKKTAKKSSAARRKKPPMVPKTAAMPLESEQEPAVPVVADLPSHDYGQGVGSLLGSASVAGTDANDAMALPELPPPALPKTFGSMTGSFIGDDAATEQKSRVGFIALIILGVVLFLVAAAGVYMFFKRAAGPTIKVVEQVQQQAAKVTADIIVSSDTAEPQGEKPVLISRVIEADISAEDTFDATGETQNADAKSGGTVVITNTTARKYTFIAGTRVLSKNGVLFRLTESTLIPPSGEVSALVIADLTGATGDITPTSFTFPGLPADLQSKVFAESKTAMSGGSGIVKSATAGDIAQGKEALIARVKEDAKKDLVSNAQEHEMVIPELIDGVETQFIAPAPGQPGAQFLLKLVYHYRALVVPQNAIEETMRARIPAVVPANAAAGEYTLGTMTYGVTSFDAEKNRAELHVEAPLVH